MQHTTPPFTLSRRQLIATIAACAAAPSWAQSADGWAAMASRARGQTVYFNAWAGSERINAYLQWTAEQVQRDYGVKLEHVKITETAEVVKRVRSEKAAGKVDGTVDLVWINGENFLTMKKEGLLFGPFAEKLPNFQYVDQIGKPTTLIDFSEPVAGMESPWGMAQLTFFADRKRVPTAPRSVAELLGFAKTNPGRFSYPRPPDFHGSTFVKQALVEVTADRAALYKPFMASAFASATAPLWAYLDALHPHLWRAARQFPANAAAQRQMMADGELLIALTFNPNEAANEIAAKRLPASVYSYQHSGGTIGNTHFLAIPFNSRVSEGAQVVANFLLSPLAQARKADIAQWGDPTVLAMDKLTATDRARFGSSVLPGQVEKTMPTIAEPHGSWVDPLEKEWLRRYG
ncbi:MAG: ABC transporter substrate-binding protein [Burkholderiaceae bacterium]